MNPLQCLINKILRRSKGEVADRIVLGVKNVFQVQLAAVEKSTSLYVDDVEEINATQDDLRDEIAELDAEKATSLKGIADNNRLADKLREFV